MAEGERFEIILTRSSLLRLKDDIYPYLEKNFPSHRAVEIVEGIFEKVDSLAFMPFRSSVQLSLEDGEKTARFSLYQTGSQFELKILFFIDELARKVYVTDFFPTRMNPTKMKLN